jgi:hypothetical protein
LVELLFARVLQAVDDDTDKLFLARIAPQFRHDVHRPTDPTKVTDPAKHRRDWPPSPVLRRSLEDSGSSEAPAD